jgi:hypothetical protein
MRWLEHVAGMREKRNTYRVMMRRPVKRRLGKHTYRWEDNIQIDH